jgi:chitin synthase
LVCGLIFVADTLSGDGNGKYIIVSLLSTYGLYALMSFLYLDPWHIFTSSLQYFLLLPSYICTLQIFAFCNTHDVSWGTKGDNNPTKSLGNATIKVDQQGNEVVEVDNITDQVDIDSAYKSSLNNIGIQRVKNKNPEKIPKESVPHADYYRDVRTRVVLSWLLSNLLLVLIITDVFSIKDAQNNTYLTFILWAVAGLALFRALGSCYYLLNKYARAMIEAKHKWEDNGDITPSFSFKNWFKKKT